MPGGNSSMLLIFGVMIVAMYFLTIRPQKKKQKEEQAMRDNIQVGDEITTIGGIIGRVVTVKEDSIIIETGADKNRLKFARWSISQNNTANEKLAAEREAAKAAQQKEKEARLEAKGKGRKKKEDLEDKY
ncbi:MAG: preprotein translocase subunit YajC [Clostridia bacterium]|nr:preprotein translocase subunit YajC [Clostridia bacterium]